MAKNSTKFICNNCGAVHNKWNGKCDECGSWGSLEEDKSSGFSNINTKSSGKTEEFATLSGDISDFERFTTKINELDRVLGGGLVKGSAILIGGDPGIGKSTIVLQAVANLSNLGMSCVYVSGEESIQQVRLRAKRLGLSEAPVNLLSATTVKDIIKSVLTLKNPDIVVIDSIQTMYVQEVGSAPGTVSQVRASAHELISFAKKNNIIMLIVGHVTKEGQIAGPKILEHMVDTVLYFEGERGHQFRIVRAIKNRFGAANEIGVFEMFKDGLREVSNPSSLFLSNNDFKTSGAVVFAGIEGTRPVLVEIQALIAKSSSHTPRRAVIGWDVNRLAMIIALLQTKCGIFLADREVYLNVAGGLKVNEPAADLAVAAALISSFRDIPVEKNTIIFGELALSGEVRMVNQSDVRINEARKLGFENAIVPNGLKNKNNDFLLNQINHINKLNRIFDV